MPTRTAEKSALAELEALERTRAGAQAESRAAHERWSPTGSGVAYTVARDQQYQLYVRRVGGDQEPRPPSGGPSPSPSPSPASGCNRYIIIDSRGSGENDAFSGPGRAFVRRFRERHPRTQVVAMRNDYPAVSIWKLIGWREWANLGGAILGIRKLGAYHDSVEDGKRWLRRKLRAIVDDCPTIKILLAGYSQGAQVAGDVYQRPSADRKLAATIRRRIVGVALFGDPYFNGRNSAVAHGSYESGLSGVLGTRARFGRSLQRHVVSYCHKHDPVCQGPISFLEMARYRFSRHKDYCVDPAKPKTCKDPRAAADLFTKRFG